MTYREATDILFSAPRHEDLAQRLGVSVASIRQARLSPNAKAYRDPPADWQKAVIQVAEAKVMAYLNLVETLCATPIDELKTAVNSRLRPKVKKD